MVQCNSAKKLSFPKSLLLYAAFFLALTFPYWLLGEVVAPYRQFAEIGAQEMIDAVHIKNCKFGDYANTYVPEVEAQLNGRRSGWLSIWTDQNELGRPLYHIFGLSRAYLPSWLIGNITDTPGNSSPYSRWLPASWPAYSC